MLRFATAPQEGVGTPALPPYSQVHSCPVHTGGRTIVLLPTSFLQVVEACPGVPTSHHHPEYLCHATKHHYVRVHHTHVHTQVHM